MNLWAIWHQTHSEYSYQVDDTTIHLLLRVASKDIKKVTLIYGDPFYWVRDENKNYHWEMKTSDMSLHYESELFDYYFLELKVPTKRVRYSFLIEGNDGNKIIYHAKGFMEVPNPLVLIYLNNFFNIPYLHQEDMNNTPDWVKETIWYQIFPDRFYNHNNPSKLKWDKGSVHNDEIYGGNLLGVIKKLPYIKSLGFNGIYFTPIFWAHTAHKYDTIDYFKIDPSFGTNEDFKQLVDEAHKLGIKIMLDGVFNHSGFFHPYFLDIHHNQEKSEYKDAFKIKKWPATDFEIKGNKLTFKKGLIPNYETFANTHYMPKWNFNSKITQKYLLDVVTYWIKDYNIDAWRLDVSNEISFDFLRKLRKSALNANPNTYILGENWDQSLPWLRGDMLDGVMNYFLTSIIWDFIDLKIDNNELKNRVVNYLVQTPKTIINNQFNLISSHDTERIKHRVNGDMRRVKIAFLLLFAAHGTPCVYYGDEIGLDGGGDPDNRRTMIWDESKWDLDLQSFITKLITLRNKYHNFNHDIKFIRNDDLLIFKKDNLTYIINNSNKEVKVNLNKKYYDLINDKEIDFAKVNSINPFELFILKEA